MKIIIGGRGSGKTTELIKMCAKDNGRIICRSKAIANYIMDIAKDMGLKINRPLTYEDFTKHSPMIQGANSLYIDDINMLLETMAGRMNVKAVTLTKDENEIYTLGSFAKRKRDDNNEG